MRSITNGFLGFIPLIFVWHLLGSPQTQLECRKITLEFSLEAGQSYERIIGRNHTLKVRADDSLKPPNGWRYSLVDSAGHDYIAPVNPPLRFNPLQILGPGYTLTT
jgi:hypothetical protein